MPDPNAPVFVTGGTGYIAKHILVRLLNAGHAVRASARSLAREAELHAAIRPHLTDPGALNRLSLVALDLDHDDGWEEALVCTSALMHTASPFPMQQPKTPEDAIRPAVDGTLRALRAAHAAGVTRVILTSSCVSIAYGNTPRDGNVYTEADWSNPDAPGQTPYARSKTLAERAAWDFAESQGMALTTINPALVVGAPLDGNYGTSIGVIERILSGSDPMLPKVAFGAVDVGDVADMHLAALDRPDSAGQRFIASNGTFWFVELARILDSAFPGRGIPTREAPNFVIRLLGLFDASISAIKPDLGRYWQVDNSAARDVLGITFRDPADAVLETGQFLIDAGKV